MADFYTARINLLYAPANDEAQPWELTTPGQYLTGEPTREWNTEPPDLVMYAAYCDAVGGKAWIYQFKEST